MNFVHKMIKLVFHIKLKHKCNNKIQDNTKLRKRNKSFDPTHLLPLYTTLGLSYFSVFPLRVMPDLSLSRLSQYNPNQTSKTFIHISSHLLETCDLSIVGTRINPF